MKGEKQMKMRTGCVAMLLVALFASAAFGAQFTINAGIGLNDKSAQFQSLQYFKEVVEKNSDGKIEVVLFHSSQLGDDRNMMEALKMGTQEMTCPSTAPMTAFINAFKIYDLPFIFANEEVADYILDGPMGKKLLDMLPDQGLVGLAYWENGFRMLTNSSRPVQSPEDLKGMKIRTMENPIHLAAFRTMGANPTPMAFGELFSAMQQKVVDGQENPWGTIFLQNFFEVQKYATDTGHVYSPFVLLISKKFWDKLPDDLKAVVQDAADQSKVHNRALNRKMNAEYLEKLKEKMDVVILTPEQKAAFQKACQPIYEQFGKDIGEDLIKEVQELSAAFKK
jgi:tripartite ATP-independent transporter DctP family solute receptor